MARQKQAEIMQSYRSELGLEDPAAGTMLRIVFMEGVKYYLLWPECTDGDNIVAGWFSTRAKAAAFAKTNNWIISN